MERGGRACTNAGGGGERGRASLFACLLLLLRGHGGAALEGVVCALVGQAARPDQVVDTAADSVDKRHFGPAERAEAGKKRGCHGRQSAARTRAQDRMPL